MEAFTEDLVRNGIPRPEAMRRARIEFGGIEQVKEQCRDATGTHVFDSLLQDIRYGLRQVRRNPGFTFVAAVSLALSVGATAVVFTAVKSVLIDPLPYSRVGELVQIRTAFANSDSSHGDWALWNDAQEIIRRSRTFNPLESTATPYLISVAMPPLPRKLFTGFVSQQFFFQLLASARCSAGIFFPRKINPATPTK